MVGRQRNKKCSIGLVVVDGFPLELSPLQQTGKDLPIPAANFSEQASDRKRIFSRDLDLCGARPAIQSQIQRHSRTRCSRTGRGKKQNSGCQGQTCNTGLQLKFATWCANEVCDISQDIFDKEIIR